jgi:hypothetical protein
VALPASDNFNRADASPAGGNWTGDNNNVRVISNTLAGTVSGFSIGHWNADAFGTDQYCQCKLDTISSGNAGGPAIRVTASNCYLFSARPASSRIDKVVSNTRTTLQTLPATAVANDTAYIEVVATTLKAKINGVQSGTDQIDSSIASGSAGFFCDDIADTYDDFLADNVVPFVPLPAATLSQFPKFLLTRRA